MFTLMVVLSLSAFLVQAQGAGNQWKALNEQLFEFIRSKDYDRAIPIAKKALKVAEDNVGANHPEVATSLNNLADLYRDQGRYADAEPLYQRSLDISEKTLGAEHPAVATSMNNLAGLYQDQGRYAEAEPLYQRSLAILERTFGPGHPSVATSLNNLAGLYQTQGRYPEAEPLYQRSLAILERTFGPEHPDVAVSLNNLAELYRALGRYPEAEPLYQRSLAIREKALGPEHPSVARGLNNLAALYRIQGRYADAEPLYQRSLAIREKALGPEHPAVAMSLNNLAGLYQAQGRYPEAEPLYQRSLDISQKTLGAEHPTVATSMNNLALLYRNQGRYPEAEPLYQRSLAIKEKALGPEHPSVATSLNNLAGLYQDQGRYADAEPFQKRSLAIHEKTLGPGHPHVATSLSNLAWLYSARHRNADALPLLRRATQIYTTRFSLKDDSARRGLRAEQRSLSQQFEDHVWLLTAAGPSAGTPEAVTAESFEVAQWARASDTAEQVAKMAARHAAGTDTLAKVARERQDLLAYLEKLEADRLAEISKPAADRKPERDRKLKQAEEETRARLTALDGRIAREFPRYGELTQPMPLSIADAQKLLGADEALLLWLVGEKESHLWAIRRERAQFARITLKRSELAAAVTVLRQRLDLGMSSDPERMLAEPFDAVRAHELYRKLFGPVEALIKGAKHLILVPDGPLQSLPPSVLVIKAPKTPIEHGEVAWLVRKYALSVLPSVGSLRALRAFAQGAQAGEPFIGFGDPQLEGEAAGQARGRRIPAGLVSRGALADPKEVRRMDPLPNTADEIRRIAASLKAPASAVHLRAQATESRVKQSDLSRVRVLAFATHGLMAGEFQGMAEPALVLTPPAQASALDDGLLTASEISQLKLNADWVVLAACNSAAADGKPGAEGFSGLSRAFFYAGARSLMVTHWYVETQSAAALSTGVFAQQAKGGTKAEALRQSILGLMGRKDIPHADHPALWAPFVVVGEGGKR